MGFGDNTFAALITRGLVEIKKLGVALGGNKDTFYGLSGLGDLIVTCLSEHSRNRKAGFLIGQGKTIEEAKKDGKFMSIDDMKIRSKIGKSVIELLEKVGCLKGMSQSNQLSLFG